MTQTFEPTHAAQPESADKAPPRQAAVTIVLGRDTRTITVSTDETLLDTARRADLSPPSMCEAGDCGTCIARVSAGGTTMRANHVLSDDEIADGYVLTCQAVPVTATVTVEYE